MPRTSTLRELPSTLAGFAVAATLAAGLVGCSSVADELDDAEGAGSGTDGGTADQADDEGEGGGFPPNTEPTDPAGTTSATGDDPDSDGPGQSVPASEGVCPEQWPQGWLFCEDFSTLSNPLESFSEYASGDGAFVIDRDLGAMRADYRAGEEGAGWVLVSLGDSPIDHGGRTHASLEHFEELYWRVNVLHEPGWPDAGPGWLARATAFMSEDWTEALVGHVRSYGPKTTLEAAAMTCVRNGLVECDVYNDKSAFEPLERFVGSTEVASSGAAGKWHCVEGHIRLNTLGKQDGVFEFWVNDNLENAGDAIDWRGEWDAYGLNAVTLENFWPDGAPDDLSRWMDDIVISTERIGCEL